MNKKELNSSEKKILKLIGKNIKYYRSKIEMSQEELSFQSGLDRAYIGRVERVENNISILSLNKISNALKIAIVKLIN